MSSGQLHEDIKKVPPVTAGRKDSVNPYLIYIVLAGISVPSLKKLIFTE